MRLAAPIKLGVPALIILTLAAVIAFMAWGTNGSAQGLGATSMVRGTVEYTVRDADGNILDHDINHNAAAAAMFTAARQTIGVAWDDLVSAAGLFDAIELCQSDGDEIITAAVCTVESDATAIAEGNPLNGSGVGVNTDAYKVDLTFTATGPVTIEGFHLCGITTQVTDQVCLVTEIGAFQDTGTIVLAATDTINIVWTITFAAG